MRTLQKYLHIWLILTSRTTAIAFASRLGAAIFILGKILRFFFFLMFLLLIVNRTHSIAGYTLWQVVFFFATFNLVDTIPQFFLREVYRFRWLVVSGDLDLFLIKPVSLLFRALLGGSDIFDLSILSLSAFFIILSATKIPGITLASTLAYLALVANAFIIALAFHIVVLSFGILTTEIDNAIMLYRDVTQMGRIPIDIYKEPIRGLLTFILPVGIMMTFPAKAIMGLLRWQFILLSFWLGGLLLLAAFQVWKTALTHYSSASS